MNDLNKYLVVLQINNRIFKVPAYLKDKEVDKELQSDTFYKYVADIAVDIIENERVEVLALIPISTLEVIRNDFGN